MASLNRFQWVSAWALRCAYVAAVGVFVWIAIRFYIPGQGFTYLDAFGDKQLNRYLPELLATDFYVQPDSFGYDAQYYAQIAMHPRFDATLHRAVDSLPYRARRILFCVTAYVLGLGSPAWALQVFSVQNIIAWLLLAWVLLRWFPPTSWQNWFRWMAVLFTFGIAFSVHGALVDGPSLLLIAIGMGLLEAGRPWWSAIVLGISGLGKETNLLAATAHAPDQMRDGADWRRTIARGVVIVAPLLLWLVYLQIRLGRADDVGARNFAPPFVGYFNKWREVLPPLLGHPTDAVGALVLVALTTQWLFFVARPRWADPWWRLGIGYAALFVVLGDAVWEGYPGAASRVLLPMTLAFNVAVPRAVRWWPVLLLGNLMVWPSYDLLKPPPVDSFEVSGPKVLCVEQRTGDRVQAAFPEPTWYGLERSYFAYWHWASGSGPVMLHNPHSYPIIVDVSFRLKTPDRREMSVRTAQREYWHGATPPSLSRIKLQGIQLKPGDTPLFFETNQPPLSQSQVDTRLFAFRVCQFSIAVKGRAP